MPQTQHRDQQPDLGKGATFSAIENAGTAAPVLDEIISGKPGYFVRKGTLVICCILLLMVASTCLIRYPDVLEGTTTLTTDPLPIRLSAPATGRLMRLYYSDNSTVRKGQPVAELENSTGFDAIQILSRYVDSVQAAIQHNDITTLKALAQADYNNLGDGQRSYNSLVDALSGMVLQQEAHIYSRRTTNLQQQISQYRGLSIVSNEERKLVDEELAQADERFKANEKLYQEKVISRQEYYDEAAKLRQKKLSLETQRRMGLQQQIAIAGNDKQLMDLEYDRTEKEHIQLAAIREQLRNLQNFIRDWKLKYLLTAPFNGTVHFIQPLQQNQQLTAGDALFGIIPEHYQYMASIQVPAQGAGKIAAGQQVQLLLDQYPSNEFGYITGAVKEMSLLPQTSDGKSFYRVAVSLPGSSLITSHHRPIAFTGSMAGTARIIVKDRNLLQRLANSFAGMNNR